nr:hypothetical transcript [Hymenolepis microstoma]
MIFAPIDSFVVLMVKYKQEMPPPGGFAPLDFLYKGTRKHLNGLYIIAGLYLCSYVGIKLRHWQREKNDAIANENKEVRLALTPFLLAEQQRMYLKQLIKNREYETELMKDVPGWEVGHWHDTPVYYNPRGLWCEPSLYEFYAHLTRRQAERQLTVHFDY